MLDYLIVGQGLAGTFVAKYLLQKGATLRIIDGGFPSASAVATGIINPVTGKRMVYANEFKILAHAAISEYQAIPGAWMPQPIVRILLTDEEQHFWRQREQHLFETGLASVPDSTMQQTLHTALREYKDAFCIHGGGRVWIDTVLRAYSQVFEEAEVYHRVTCNAHQIAEQLHQHSDTAIRVGGHSFRRVVFCEGWRIHNNPLFAWLPFVFAKGHILSAEVDFPEALAPLPLCIMGGKHLSHTEMGIYRFGSTYEWNDVDENVKPEATLYLQQELQHLLKATVRSVQTHVGVRSVLQDIKPIIGRHPKYEQVFVVNGLASKGALYAPFMANALVEYMEEQKELPLAYTIQRFQDNKSGKRNE